MFAQQLGKLRVHARGDEKIPLVGQRFLELAPNVVLLDDDLLDLVLREQGFEFAVGYGLDLLAGRPPVADEHDGHKGKEQIPEVELRLLVHDLAASHRRVRSASLAGAGSTSVPARAAPQEQGAR